MPTPEPEDTGPSMPELRAALIDMAADERILFFDGWDDCVVGIVEIYGQPTRVAYSVDLLLKAIEARAVRRPGEDPIEYFERTLVKTYAGPYTPALLYSSPNTTIDDTDEP